MDTATAHGAAHEIGIPARNAWVPYALLGATSVLAGLWAIFIPDTVAAVSLILGLELLLLGALELVEALDEEDGTGRTLEVVLAILAIVAGVVVLRRPSETLTVLLLAAGIYLVLSGLTLLVRAFLNIRMRGLRPLGGLLMLAVGVVILAWPDIGLRTLAVLLGIGLVVRGLTAVGVAWLLRIVSEPAGTARAVGR